MTFESQSWPESLDVFYGELNFARAAIYVRLSRSTPVGDPQELESTPLTLAGVVRGPRNRHARQLSAAYTLTDLGPGPTLLARAMITDPCLWSPESPAAYDLTIELKRGERTIAQASRQIGLRSLAVVGRRFLWQGNNWVLRGAARQVEELSREFTGALVCRQETASDQLLQAASVEGVFLLVMIDGDNGIVDSQAIRRLASWPAVAGIILSGDATVSREALRRLAPNLLFGRFAVEGEIAPWSDQPQFIIAHVKSPESFAAWGERLSVPLIAWRVAECNQEAIRGECDRLQRDLAPFGQFAGYVV